MKIFVYLMLKTNLEFLGIDFTVKCLFKGPHKLSNLYMYLDLHDHFAKALIIY